jgi:hypothetical protein
MTRFNGSIVFVIFVQFLLVGCTIPTMLLQDGYTKVPLNNDVFDLSLEGLSLIAPAFIDTMDVYEAFDRKTRIPFRMDNNPRGYYEAIRFYSSGKFTLVVVPKNRDLELKYFDPRFTGYRGICYEKAGEARFILYCPISESRKIGKCTGKISLQDGNLIFSYDNSNHQDAFIPMSLPIDISKCNSGW